ncbi:protein FAR-RED IMPAIRED RESPONSE 1-like [Trifolium pratense]|nr:protein FAR-RED IMPAIRED RESPONSE 1-like [Trifolium pratense]
MDTCVGFDGEASGVDSYNGEQESWEPATGMSFSSIDEVKSFYGKYASIKGFGWKIRTSRKGEDGKLNYLMLSCSREGRRVSEIPRTLKTLPTKVKNCPSKITIKLAKDELWYIKKFEPNHSHTISPTKSRLFKANKNISMHVKRTIHINDDAGVRINKTFQTLVRDAGGYENVAFFERDVRNFVNKERRVIGKDGDAKALISYFCQMREQNTNFFYNIDLDDDFHVRNVFWADARSRTAYESFGDVVTFDTTYLTNKYDMPFAAFVGVNHHGQSTLLGCGLLSAEDTESFVWLFQSWLRCMLGKAPAGIVTDQCKAMQNAIELVFPTTRHRWCLWHIMKKIPEKLSRYGEYKNITFAMKEAVYDTITPTEFEEKWCSFVNKFKLEHNDWLSGLYKECHRWVPIMLKKYFWAGMSTTQRSESIHAFFDGYIKSTTTLRQFVKQYDNALRSRAEKEFEADFQSMDTIIPCGSNSLIEKQFQVEYTHAKFKEVQVEFRAKMNCVPSLKTEEGNLATYHVLEEMLVGDRTKDRIVKVVFDRGNHDVSCECSLFEFRGILCRHVLCVCTQERVKNMPLKYVLVRWSKNVKRKHSYIKCSYSVTELKPQMDRFDNLCKHFYEVAEVAADFEDATKALHQRLHEFKSNLLCMVATSNNVNKSSNNDSNPNNITRRNENMITEIRSPLRVTRKGRPPLNRKISAVEKVVQKCKKRRTNKRGDKLTTKVDVVTDGVVNVGGNASFTDLLTTSEIDFTGSSEFSTN